MAIVATTHPVRPQPHRRLDPPLPPLSDLSGRRGLASGGIEFDFDKPNPDPWRLRLFAEKQMNAGNLPATDYLLLVDDEERFNRAAKGALARAGQ